MQKSIQKDIKYTQEKWVLTQKDYLKTIEKLEMELTRAEAIKSISQQNFEKVSSIHKNMKNLIDKKLFSKKNKIKVCLKIC